MHRINRKQILTNVSLRAQISCKYVEKVKKQEGNQEHISIYCINLNYS